MQSDLVQEDLAAVWGEVLQSGQGFAEDLQKAALHSEQGLLLSLLPLPSTRCLFGGCLWGPMASGEGARGQRLTIFNLRKS